MNIRKFEPWHWFDVDPENRRVPISHSILGPVDDLHGMIDRLFVNTLRGRWPGEGVTGFPGAAEGLFIPKLDVKATDKEYDISAELPGVQEKDISIEVEDRTFVLSGEKKDEREEKKEGEGGHYRMERRYGSFRRVLTLPDDADVDGAKAEFKDGVLKVTFPRKALAAENKKSIPINPNQIR